jgi:hypothetical protein
VPFNESQGVVTEGQQTNGDEEHQGKSLKSFAQDVKIGYERKKSEHNRSTDSRPDDKCCALPTSGRFIWRVQNPSSLPIAVTIDYHE